MAAAPELSTQRQAALLARLQRLATDRHEAEQRIAIAQSSETRLAHERFRREADAIVRAHAATTNEAESRHAAAVAELDKDLNARREAVQAEYHGVRSAAETQRGATEAEALELQRRVAFETLSIYEARKDEPAQRREQALAPLGAAWRSLEALAGDTVAILKSRRQFSSATDVSKLTTPSPPQPADTPAVEAVQQRAEATAAEARRRVEALYAQKLPRLFEGATPWVLVGGVALCNYALAAWRAGPVSPFAWGAAVGALVASGALLRLLAWPKSRAAGAEAFDGIASALADARSAIQTYRAAALLREQEEAQSLVDTRDAELAAVGFEVKSRIDGVTAQVEQELVRAGRSYPHRLETLRAERESGGSRLDAELAEALGRATAQRDADAAASAAQRDTAIAEINATHDRDWAAMAEAWLSGVAEIHEAFAAERSVCDAHFPADWEAIDLDAWRPTQQMIPAVEFGRVTIDLARVKHALPEDPRLAPPTNQIEVPALVTLNEQPSLFVLAEGAGRAVAAELVQTVAFRFLTGLPAGKVRFTLLDPTGLGESFAAFMHLADYDDNLIAGRIWAEPRDIDEQLARVTNHMETVIQKFLRDEYATIHEYNAQAGEVAEPLQVVVIAGFPHAFSDTAVRRLISIVSGGPRCGVYVLASIDRTARFPSDFRLGDLTEDAVLLEWLPQAERLTWRQPVFEKFPLAVAGSPPGELMVDAIRRAGQAAKGAIKVEAPFSIVAPDPDHLWEDVCSDELLIPVGRAGANRLQYVRLGKGAAHHLLVAGKTGSGKSTFLHALVTSAALRFTPDELEFYLVDFKKGVEFQAYAYGRLPHARVVAIESEREFGLSVLERLDEELKRRGELYREVAVQGLADYRAARPDDPMPRILLVIDEFQELFVEDDRLAQDAQLLLDRLVRQGRAFGMHVILGTQTLSGAYSIARSTLGQIAVRVALQSSEADAHLILSDERNTAARYLRRPGEAIYNDQNGLLAANEPFQVVWLPDAQRIDWLALAQAERERRGVEVPPTIVFEGAAPADPQENKQLTTLLTQQAQLADGLRPVAVPQAWLGDAIAIKPPTRAEFGRHAGANLLMVGPNEAEAAGILSAAAVALAASHPEARVVVLDGTRADDGAAAVWPAVAAALGDRLQRYDAGQTTEALASVASEAARRDEANEDHAPPLFLIVWNAGRLRELRRSEDDFSFSSDRDKPASPDKQFAELLRSGPGLGVHALVWCDSYNTVGRITDRMTLREFGMRIAFQMSAADSSNLLDTPAAARLRAFRALFYSDETGQIEKFRPYGLPTKAWLEWVQKSLSQTLSPAE
ncbi:FtsK-like domain-containing protein [Pirellulimonas nuda]|uniref:FtsK-like domain-containing protein n=1 Tax=Pirellulimonas nuda TaxID=2528009 RepID=A0A518D9D9_9BACT|nr:FtsK/SpoIIIE domain-containing protein [Pirellulimonas nuda]QDU88094.1 FtsK-like domain-containing protein [Pirellulimonas nuda]